MSEKYITQVSKKFYEQFHFPGSRPVDQDGLIFLRRFAQSVGKLARKKNDIHVLDAGCGTGNTSISLAGIYKEIQFMGIDNSAPSLIQAASDCKKRGLNNLKFQRWNLLKPIRAASKFDIILCLGVLHHTANMEKVLINLNNILNENGELFLWIYGKHGRYNHSLNMQLLKMLLETEPKPENISELAGEFAVKTQEGLPLKELIGKTKTNEMQLNAFKSPVWIADQFLNPHELLIDMNELLHLVKSAGFKITQVLGTEQNISGKFNSPELSKRFSSLSKVKRLIAADLLLKPDRYFVLLQKYRPGRRKK
jgi:2-polyprenyl-3-methyl-5-hydroxy-6-metoxy-1,4-benzoquinol methylase